MTPNNSILNLLQGTDSVTVVLNTTHPDKPLITPLVDDAGNPKTDNNGHPLGSIRLEQNSRTLTGTFLNAKKRVAFIGGTMELLESIVKQAGLKEGSIIPGKIKITESLEPMFKSRNGEQSPKINPNTKEVVGVTVGGTFYPVYMQMTYTDDLTAKDILIRTSEDAIAWLNARNMSTTLAPLTAAANNAVETSRVPATDVVDEIVGG